MGLTPVYNWPYPELNNPPDGATQMKNLALGIEGTVKTNALPPLCVLEKTSAQSFTDNVFIAATFDVESIDNSGMHVAGNTSRMTATVAGWYQVSGGVTFPSNPTGVRRTQVTKNGVAVVSTISLLATSGYAMWVTTPLLVLRLNVGDYVEVVSMQNSGTALSVTGGHAFAQFICS